jgi:hypothetical protein
MFSPRTEGFHAQNRHKKILDSEQDNWTKLNSVAWVRERTIPIERTPHVGEVIAYFLRIEWRRVVSEKDPYCRILGFLDRQDNWRKVKIKNKAIP